MNNQTIQLNDLFKKEISWTVRFNGLIQDPQAGDVVSKQYKGQELTSTSREYYFADSQDLRRIYYMNMSCNGLPYGEKALELVTG